MKDHHSLRWRLTAWMLFVFVTGLVAATLFSLYEMGEGERTERARLLQEQAREILASSRTGADGRLVVELPPALIGRYTGPDAGLAFTLYDADRQPLLLSPGLEAPLPLLPLAADRVFGRQQPLDDGERWALAVRAPQDQTLIVARGQLEQVALIELFVDELYEFSSIFIVFGVASFGLIWAIVGWSLRPVDRASREAAAIGPNNLAGRISSDGLPREVRPLVDAINSAFSRLDDAYDAQRRFTADAAHELRTPLTVLSLRLERARTESTADWPGVERDLTQMKRLIAQLLELARKENAGRATGLASRRPVNLPRLVREAAATLLPLVEARGRTIEVDAPDVLIVPVLPDDLGDAVRNLLENALVHGAGRIHITVCEAREGGERRALIEVADQGQGIPAALIDTVFERFRKAVATSPGAGLGLAIVRHVARSHGGEASVRPGPHGAVRLSLPITRSERAPPPTARAAPPRPRHRSTVIETSLVGATDASL